MSVTRITPWAVNGPASNYGLAASLSGTATNVPTGALIVTSVQAQTTTQPSVSDTAGNLYTVVLGESSSTRTSTWIAYCLSAIANSANVVTWTAGSAVLTGAQGATYTTSSGTWSFDKTVAGLSAYATALALSITTTGAGVIYGAFGEYYTGADTWSITGLTAQASQTGSSSGNGTIGCLLADDITSASVSGLSISVTDANGAYGGYIAGIAASFVVSGGAMVTASRTEAASAADTSSVTIIRFANQTEAGSAADASTQTNAVSKSSSETATATDSASQGQVLTASTAEAASASDSSSALRQILASIDEAATAVQAATSSAQVTKSAAEAASATDAATSTQAGVSSVNETATAIDSPQSIGQVTKSATEAVSATDSLSSGNQLQAALTEAATATDALSAYRVLSAAAQEIASATDTLTALLQQVVAVDEAATAQDLIAQINSLSAAITEAATATDAPITIQTLALIVSWQFYARQAARFFYAAAPFRAFYAKAPFRSFYALCQSDMAVPIPYAIDPSETKVLTLDATADLPSGVTLTGTPTIAVVVTKGNDPNASAHFTGAVINSTPISVTTPSGASVTIATGLAVQLIASGCVDGTQYEIRITCQTSESNNVEALKATLSCTAS